MNLAVARGSYFERIINIYGKSHYTAGSKIFNTLKAYNISFAVIFDKYTRIRDAMKFLPGYDGFQLPYYHQLQNSIEESRLFIMTGSKNVFKREFHQAFENENDVVVLGGKKLAEECARNDTVTLFANNAFCLPGLSEQTYIALSDKPALEKSKVLWYSLHTQMVVHGWGIKEFSLGSLSYFNVFTVDGQLSTAWICETDTVIKAQDSPLVTKASDFFTEMQRQQITRFTLKAGQVLIFGDTLPVMPSVISNQFEPWLTSKIPQI